MTDPVQGLRLDPSSELTIAGQIRAQLTLLIADGRLAPGSRLPSVRSLATRLAVNVNTVRSAYARLEADGVVVTRHGVGTTVLGADAGSLSPSVPNFMSNTVGVLIAGLDPFYLDLVRGIEMTGDEQGTLLFIVDSRDSEPRARAAIRQLGARGVEGVIAVSTGGPPTDGTEDRALPVVYVDQPDRSGHVLVFNAAQAGYAATRHLLDHGHRRIGFVTCPLDWSNQAELFDGHRRALSEAGLASDPSLLATVGGFTVAAGREGLQALRRLAAPPSAVVASGGMLALGILEEAKRLGLNVPGQLAIAGYADIEATRFTSPAITMVSLPTYQIGAAAMQLLRRVVADPKTPPTRTTFDGVLVVRESCGPHPDVERTAP